MSAVVKELPHAEGNRQQLDVTCRWERSRYSVSNVAVLTFRQALANVAGL